MDYRDGVLDAVASARWSDAGELLIAEATRRTGARAAALASLDERAHASLISGPIRMTAVQQRGATDRAAPADAMQLVEVLCGEQAVGLLTLEDACDPLPEDVARLAAVICAAHRAVRSPPRHAEDIEVRRLQTLGRLSANLAHEVKNALQVITGQASLLLDPAERSAGWVDSVSAIARNGARASRLLSRFLAAGKPEAREGTTDPARVLTEATQLFTALCGKHVRVELELAAGLPRVDADASELEQVLLNLLLNARDAMPRGGTIRVRASALANHVRLTVADSGSGISPEVLRRIFDPLFTTKPGDRGTGLGLSIVRELVEGWGGRVRVHSRVGSGSAFVVQLPTQPMRNTTAWPEGWLSVRCVDPARAVLLLADLAARTSGGPV